MPVPSEQPVTLMLYLHSSSEGPTPDWLVQLSATVPEVSHLTGRFEGSMSSAMTREVLPTKMVDGEALRMALGVGVGAGVFVAVGTDVFVAVGTGVFVGVAVGQTHW